MIQTGLLVLVAATLFSTVSASYFYEPTEDVVYVVEKKSSSLPYAIRTPALKRFNVDDLSLRFGKRAQFSPEDLSLRFGKRAAFSPEDLSLRFGKRAAFSPDDLSLRFGKRFSLEERYGKRFSPEDLALRFGRR